MIALSTLILLASSSRATARDFPWPFRHKEPNVQSLFIPFDALSPRQHALLETLKTARHVEGSLSSFWDSLGRDSGRSKKKKEDGNSIQRTFFATTDALEHRKVKGGETALDQVEAIEDVAGDEKGAGSAEQFNIEVRWKAPPPGMKSIRELFDDESGYAGRFSTDHPGEQGIQEKSEGYRGLHLLFMKDDEQKGHVHIDFRATNWFEAMMTKLHLKFLIPKFLRKGHFKPSNGDVGAVGPEKKDGEPISNVEWFVQTYGDPRVREFLNPVVHNLPNAELSETLDKPEAAPEAAAVTPKEPEGAALAP